MYHGLWFLIVVWISGASLNGTRLSRLWKLQSFTITVIHLEAGCNAPDVITGPKWNKRNWSDWLLLSWDSLQPPPQPCKEKMFKIWMNGWMDRFDHCGIFGARFIWNSPVSRYKGYTGSGCFAAVSSGVTHRSRGTSSLSNSSDSH